MAKLLVVCCDGTWDRPDELGDGTPTPTNVTKIALALADKDNQQLEQRMFYHLGVGALGIPMTPSALAAFINRRTRFHDTDLSSQVGAAFQALAIDEKRGPFFPTLWTHVTEGQRVEQVWFTGVHRDVGGGYPQHQLSDITFRWMMDRARECGLAFVDGSDTALRVSTNPVPGDDVLTAALQVDPNPLAAPHNSLTFYYRLLPRYRRTLGIVDRIHEFAASTAVQRLAAHPEDPSPGLDAYLKGRGQIKDVDADITS